MEDANRMESGVHTVELDFLGQRIALKSKGDPEMIEETVDAAMMKLTDAENRAPGAAPHKIALLALLDMAEEYVKAKHRGEVHREAISQKSRELVDFLKNEFNISGTSV